MNIMTDSGLVTEVEPCEQEGVDGYAVYGDPDEGFYPADSVEVVEDEQDNGTSDTVL